MSAALNIIRAWAARLKQNVVALWLAARSRPSSLAGLLTVLILWAAGAGWLGYWIGSRA